MQEKHSSFIKKIKVYSGAEALAAASFSVCFSALILIFIGRIIYSSWPSYSEFVAGGTIYSGYNKKGDLTVFYLLYLLILFLFFAFLFVKHSIKKVNNKENYVNQERSGNLYEYIKQMIVTFLLGSFAVIALETAIGGRVLEKRELLAGIRNGLLVVWLIGMILLSVISYKKKKSLKRLIQLVEVVSQFILPVSFLGYFGFYYKYQGAYIELYHSTRWKMFCLILTVLMILYQLYRVYKKKSGLSLSSIICIAVMTVMRTPEGVLSVDFFHNGEMAIPMQQLVEFHKLPYFDFDPIHGLCDYIYSGFNYVFFDGSYFSQNAGIVIALSFCAALLSVVFAVCFGDRNTALILVCIFMPFFALKAGIRYVLFFAAFSILLSDKVRKNSAWFLWWYVLLCMLSIAYNVSIGASMAVAFLPEVLYRFIKDFIPSLKKGKDSLLIKDKKLMSFYGVLFVCGCLYIPFFMQIIRFLKENANTTIWVNGTAIFGSEFKFVETFAFVIPYVCFMILAFSNQMKEDKKGVSAFISFLVCLFVISNYACVRYDEGLRLSVLGIFFSFILLAYFGKTFLCEKWKWPLAILILMTSLFLLKNYLPIRMAPIMAIEEVPDEKEVLIQETLHKDPVVYVSGDSVGLGRLGTGFIQGTTLSSLQNIQTVLQNEFKGDYSSRAFLDLTNKISHYVIFDIEAQYDYSSAYNISNQIMQNKAIELIKKNRPHLILLSPYIRFDEAPVSLRSPKLYQSIMQMGYKPYVYQDVMYLLDSESAFSESIDGKRMLGLLNHRTELLMLPYLWGTALGTEKDTLDLVAEADSCIKGNEIDYMEILIPKDQICSESFCLSFQSAIDGEKYEYIISTGLEKKESLIENEEKEVRYIIPLSASPFFYYTDSASLRVEGIDDYKVNYYRYLFD